MPRLSLPLPSATPQIYPAPFIEPPFFRCLRHLFEMPASADALRHARNSAAYIGFTIAPAWRRHYTRCRRYAAFISQRQMPAAADYYKSAIQAWKIEQARCYAYREMMPPYDRGAVIQLPPN